MCPLLIPWLLCLTIATLSQLLNYYNPVFCSQWIPGCFSRISISFPPPCQCQPAYTNQLSESQIYFKEVLNSEKFLILQMSIITQDTERRHVKTWGSSDHCVSIWLSSHFSPLFVLPNYLTPHLNISFILLHVALKPFAEWKVLGLCHPESKSSTITI